MTGFHHRDIISKRIKTISFLVENVNEIKNKIIRPTIILTTINSWLQKIPPKNFYLDNSFLIQKNSELKFRDLQNYLIQNGYERRNTVREYGEFSIRGDIVDIFSSNEFNPVRIDFFDDFVERIRDFDPISQITSKELNNVNLKPAYEYILNEKAIKFFRQSYLQSFGGKSSKDSIYISVSNGKPYPGLEHFLNFFHEKLFELEEIFLDIPKIFDYDLDIVAEKRIGNINDLYNSRLIDGKQGENIYRPVTPNKIYKTSNEFKKINDDKTVIKFKKFGTSNTLKDNDYNCSGRIGKIFSNFKKPYEELENELISKYKSKVILICLSSESTIKRLFELLKENIRKKISIINKFEEINQNGIFVMIWNLYTGFETNKIYTITETDIFGSKNLRPNRKKRRSENFLKELSSLERDDFVVHIEHGIGQYKGLKKLENNNVFHDFIQINYANDDKLYLPVENIELLSKYGTSENNIFLDKLGGIAWQTRKAKVKGKIKELAQQLIKTAALRETKTIESIKIPNKTYLEFVSKFGFIETEDQYETINEVLNDLSSGKISDRLICGDVGYGKTEVALRAAFVVAMSGFQVALVTPTTLLSRQHGILFKNRFNDFPIKIATLSRLTSSKNNKLVKEGIKNGDIQIIIGTHSLLNEKISFNNLALLIIDEEQKFGVIQKEKLKKLKTDIHVLTLTATPIPRTLQLALSGMKKMSIISTPPVDRTAVRSFVCPWDNLVIKEAISREVARGGQCFVVCPKIKNLQKIYDRILKLVPNLRVLTAHGKMNSKDLDEVMTKFSFKEADLLLSTNIIESGLDISNANTIIIYRSDLFGLSQLYQLKGRVGRSPKRAYAYLTIEDDVKLTSNAEKRLNVMQTLDNLGAGFSISSFDMDIRGAGNLLGDEQSGHVKEVGFELYQNLLNKEVQNLNNSNSVNFIENDWSPQISLGTSVFIPEDYIPDLSVRLSFYRRIGDLKNKHEIDELQNELINRFGKLPNSLNNLFEIVLLKNLCLKLNILKLEVGKNGALIQFKNNNFKNAEKLINFINRNKEILEIKPNQKLLYKQNFTNFETRAKKVILFLDKLFFN